MIGWLFETTFVTIGISSRWGDRSEAPPNDLFFASEVKERLDPDAQHNSSPSRKWLAPGTLSSCSTTINRSSSTSPRKSLGAPSRLNELSSNSSLSSWRSRRSLKTGYGSINRIGDWSWTDGGCLGPTLGTLHGPLVSWTGSESTPSRSPSIWIELQNVSAAENFGAESTATRRNGQGPTLSYDALHPFLQGRRCFHAVCWNCRALLHRAPAKRFAKLRYLTEIVKGAKIVLLQEVHGTAQEIKRLLHRFRNVFYVLCNFDKDRNAGGIFTMVEKEWAGSLLNVTHTAVVFGRISRVEVELPRFSRVAYNVHNYGLDEDCVQYAGKCIEDDRQNMGDHPGPWSPPCWWRLEPSSAGRVLCPLAQAK